MTGTGKRARGDRRLARRQIVAEELRVEQAALDDAFLALTERLPPRGLRELGRLP